jgi:uncharacterized membrane protein YadS
MLAAIASTNVLATCVGMKPMPTLRQWSLTTSNRACAMPSGGAVPSVASACAAAYRRKAAAKSGHDADAAHCASNPCT